MNYKKSREDNVWLIPIADIMTALAVFFMVMFQLTTISQQSHLEQSGKLEKVYDALYIVKATWSGESSNDVDLYLRNPNKKVIYFKAHDEDGMTLERDTTGQESIYLPDGNAASVATSNDEIISVRVLMAGDYIANVHLYKKHDERKQTPVTVKLYRAVGLAYTLLHENTVTLMNEADEKTAFGFRIEEDGTVSHYNETQVSFVHK